jgi:hypothetical protein
MNPAQMFRSILSLLLVLTILINPIEARASVLSDAAAQAQNLIGELNPINLALGPLINDAIARGDDALRQRLEQLHAIIQEALFTLNQIAQQRIEQVNQDVIARLQQLQQITNQSIEQLNALAQGRITQIDSSLQARITQMGDATANVIASLPIPIEPLLNVGPTGITTVRQSGMYTTLLLTGSGLFKNNTKPEAYLIDSEKAHAGIDILDVLASLVPVGCASASAGKGLDVPSASMGLIEIKIPNSYLPSNRNATEFTLKLQLRRGNSFFVFPSYSTPTFPLHVCGSLPPYSIEVTQSASGEAWEKRTIPYPGSGPTKGHPYGFYIDDNGGNNHLDICAIASEGYQVDDAPFPGFSAGLSVGSEGGDHYHNISSPKPGCVHLYADNRNGGANEWIADVYVRQRKLTPVQQCNPPVTTSLQLKYGVPNQIILASANAIGPCGEAGVNVTPTVTTRVFVKDSTGTVVETLDLTPNVPQTALDGAIHMTLGATGLLNLTLDSVCRWKFDELVQTASH